MVNQHTKDSIHLMYAYTHTNRLATVQSDLEALLDETTTVTTPAVEQSQTLTHVGSKFLPDHHKSSSGDS